MTRVIKMNEHIELVKKWLDNPESVSQKERDENAEAAWAAWDDNAWAVYMAAVAADWAAAGNVEWAKYWVDEYEELTNNKNERA